MPQLPPIFSKQNSSKRLLLLLLVLFFILPFGKGTLINIVLTLFLIHSFISVSKQGWKSALRSPIFILPGAYLVFQGLSILWASDVSEGLIQFNIKMGLLVIPFVLVANKSLFKTGFRPKIIQAFLWGNVVAGLFVFAYAAYRVLSSGSWFFTLPGSDYRHYYFLYEDLAEPLMHPGYLSTYIGFAIIIALYLLLFKQTQKRLLTGLVLFFLFFTLVMLQGRINILALFAVLGLGAIIATFKLKAYKWLVLPAAPLVLLLGFVLFASPQMKSRYFQAPDFSYDISGNDFNSATYRLAEWLCAFDVIEENIWLGVGMGDNRKALQDAYKERAFWAGAERKFNAHNQYVETSIATGLAGFILLLILLVGYGRLAWRQKKYGLLSCLVFFAISMLTESMFERTWALNLFAIFFPVMLLKFEEDQN